MVCSHVYTLHVANFGAARPATITGIPAGIKALRAVRTSVTDSFRELEPVAVVEATAKTTLARQSLLTLTTMPAAGPGESTELRPQIRPQALSSRARSTTLRAGSVTRRGTQCRGRDARYRAPPAQIPA